MGSPEDGSNGSSRQKTITGMALRSDPPPSRSKQAAVSFERDTQADDGVGEAVYQNGRGRLTMKGHKLQSQARLAGEQIAAAVKQTLDEPTKEVEEGEKVESPIPESEDEKVKRKILALFPREPVLPPPPEPTPEEQRAALDAMDIPDLYDENVLQPTRLPVEELPLESISSLIHRSKMALVAAISLGTVLGVAGGKYVVAPTLKRIFYGDAEATLVSPQQKPEKISPVPVSSSAFSTASSVPDVVPSASVSVPVFPNYTTSKRPVIFGSGSASPSVLVPVIPSAAPAVSTDGIETKSDTVNPWEGQDLPKIDTTKSDQDDPWNKQPKTPAPSSSQ